jgi:Zn-dependent peptidase ImmA (M78 family)/DNA-binding XRE family transcriptional regulator
MIYGERIRQVRELHRMTQSDLISEVPGLTQPRLSRIEKGLAPLDPETAAMIAAACGVSTDFFETEPSVSIKALSPQFRARNKLTQGDKSSALHWADLILEQYLRLREGLEPTRSHVPTIESKSPKDAAAEMRRFLGFAPHVPLPYLLLAVERIGVAALGLPIQLPAMDAFSAWSGGLPVICILRGSAGDRLRFSVAHELGHLILHRDVSMSPTLESEADEFASELLMPAEIARRVIPRNATLSSLVMIKGQWGVSVKSLVYRARTLSILPEDRCISLYKQISARGWNKSEPGYVPVEKPRAFMKIVEEVYGPGPNVERLAKESNWSHALATEVLSEHATADDLPFEVGRQHRNSAGSDDLAEVIQIRRARRP